MALDPNTASVGERSARQQELEAKRELPRALMGGTTTMRAAGEKFMPRHKAETDTTYKARLNGTTLFNAFKDAVLKQNGKLYGEPVALNDDVPPALVTLCQNVDGQGRALTPFAMDATQSAWVDGVSYILVDFPKLQPEVGQTVVTLADQQRAGARPYWVLVKASQLLGMRTEDTGGAQRLTQVRLLETITRPSGDYGEEVIERVRVLLPGGFEVWEPVKNQTTKQWQLVEEGATTNREIMLVPIYTNRVGFMEGEPPLSSLAELNAEHWLSSSENRHALTFLRFAMLAFTGFSQEELNTVEVGPDKGIAVPTGGTVAYIEHSGKGIEAGFTDLAKIEERMETAGMTVRVENAGAVTATTSAINSAESNAALKAVAKALEDSLAQALQYTADLLKIPEGGHVTVYSGFAETAPQGSIDELIKLRSTSNLSRQTLWDILKQRAVLPEDFDEEVEAERIGNADLAMDLGPPPTNAAFR